LSYGGVCGRRGFACGLGHAALFMGNKKAPLLPRKERDLLLRLPYRPNI